MIHAYKSVSRLGKVFLWLSVILLLAFVIVYVMQVQSALSMDPSSYNCTSDSMVMRICHDPYGSSIGWTMIYLGYMGWPFFIAWLVIGATLLHRRKSRITSKK